MSLLCPSRRRLAHGLALASAVAAAAAPAAVAAPAIHTDRGCYVVGAPVRLTGSGFAPMRTYVVSVDDVYFGQEISDPQGGFTTSLKPGGLGAGIAEAVDRLDATDGTVAARTTFTLTRTAGARLLATGGTASALRAPFQVWGFSLTGQRRSVYVHYVGPGRTVVLTRRLGRTRGQCGYLRTRRLRVFPFIPGAGRWTLQVDTRRRYSSRPRGAVARIILQVS